MSEQNRNQDQDPQVKPVQLDQQPGQQQQQQQQQNRDHPSQPSQPGSQQSQQTAQHEQSNHGQGQEGQQDQMNRDHVQQLGDKDLVNPQSKDCERGQSATSLSGGHKSS